MSATNGPVGAAPVGQSDRVNPGQRWLNRYLVAGGIGEPVGRWYKATDTEQGVAVLLRVTTGRAAGRTAVWQKILDLSPPHVLRPLAVHEGVERVEVWAAPAGEPLRRSLSPDRALDKERVSAIARQLTAAVESLHYAGVGHFSINAGTVYVHEGRSGPVVTLGGFESAALYEGKELIPLAVDPFTSPPEAVGLFQHSPGESLRAWDWWSVGRLLQELVLGGTVVEHLPEMQRLRPLPVCAHALLSEREIPGLRAGGVELMPELDQSFGLLLRGLLTTAVTGRWSGIEVKEWLAGRQPPERYAAARHERFFRFQGRGYTVPEFARVLQAAPAPDERIRHLFAADQKDTVAGFLNDATVGEDLEKRAEAGRELAEAVALKQYPEPLRKEIAATVAWHGIGGGGFLWRGQALNDAKLREQLASAAGFPEWRGALLALSTPLVMNHINGHDPDAVRLLERLVKTAGEAEEQALKSRWLKPNSPAAQAAIWLAALEPESKLQAIQQKLQEEYAASDDAAFQAVFAAEKPTRVMQVLVAWAAAEPRAFRLVTHGEMKARRQKALMAEAESLAGVIFWLRLDRAMRAGPWLFGGRWFLIAAGLVLVSLLAVHVPGPWGVALGLVPLLALVGARLGVNRWQAGLVRRCSPRSPPWDWRAGPARSAREASALARQGGLANLAGAPAAMKRVVAELAKLEPDVKPPQPPRHAATWAVVAFGWLVVLGLVAGSVVRGLAHPPSWPAHTAAWQKAAEKKPKRAAKPEDAGPIKVSWPYKVQQDAFEITVKGAFTPTSEQAAAAVRKGKALISPYKLETINSLIALYVPLGEGQGGLLLFDAKKGALFGRTGVKIDFVPFARSTLQIGDQTVFFVEL